jgi:hypothetical protein
MIKRGRNPCLLNPNKGAEPELFNPLPLLFKSPLPGQQDCVFFSGHLNLHAKPETGIPYREKIL